MSEENVEVVRRVFDAVTHRDSEAVLDAYDFEVEWDASQSPWRPMLGSDVYRGKDGLRRFFREWYEAWENLQNHVAELIDAGDHVISVVTDRGRGLRSGAEVERTHAGVWTIREGKIVRVAWFPTREEALRAARLSD